MPGTNQPPTSPEGFIDILGGDATAVESTENSTTAEIQPSGGDISEVDASAEESAAKPEVSQNDDEAIDGYAEGLKNLIEQTHNRANERGKTIDSVVAEDEASNSEIYKVIEYLSSQMQTIGEQLSTMPKLDASKPEYDERFKRRLKLLTLLTVIEQNRNFFIEKQRVNNDKIAQYAKSLPDEEAIEETELPPWAKRDKGGDGEINGNDEGKAWTERAMQHAEKLGDDNEVDDTAA